jgi:hypothetical protein
MSANSQNLGKAVLDLEVNKAQFSKDMREGKVDAGGMREALDAIAKVARVAEIELNKVKLDGRTSAESNAIADRIERSISSVGRAAMEANEHLEHVKLGEAQAAESEVAAKEISAGLNEISRNADQAKRKLTEVRVSQSLGSKQIGGTSVGLLGAAVAGGTLIGPAAGPAVAGALASIPAFAGMGVGVLGTLALAFHGVTSAIEGDKKAFDGLNPTAQEFVQTVRSLDGFMKHLEQVADQAMFPGLTEGLKSALSPSTVGAVTRALEAFGDAIGQVATEWGKFFGSSEFASIFGPLMASGAHNLVILSSAALSLFDALGVLGRAAIPLETWLSTAARDGAELVDSWLHAKDASGQLGDSMNEAKTSLQLVGNLIVSLGRVIGDLGAALYPVSKVALKDLTNGLNSVADFIDRNKTVIRELVGGALSDFVAVVKTASEALGAFYRSMRDDLGNSAPIVAGIMAIGAAIAIAMGPEAAVIAGAIFAAGEIIRHWSEIKTWFTNFGQFLEIIFKAAWQGVLGIVDAAIYGMLLEVQGLAEGLGKALGWVPGIGGKIKAAMHDVVSFVDQFKDSAAAHFAAAGDLAGNAWADAFKSNAITAITTVAGAAAAAASGAVDPETAAKAAHGVGQNVPPAKSASGKYSTNQVYQLLINAGFTPDQASNFVGIAGAESGLRYNALNDNPNTKDYSAGLFQENFYGALGPDRTARYAPMFGLSGSMDPKAFVAWLRMHPAAQATIAHDLFSSSGYSPWKGDAYVESHPGLLSDTTPVFGNDPAFAKNLGKKPPKPPVIPVLATDLANRAKVNAGNASALHNVGGTAKRYLQDELSDLTAEQSSLQKAYNTAKGKSKIELGKALATVEAKIPKVQALIKDAIVVTGDALLPASLRTQLAAAIQKFKADSTYAQSLTGKAAQDFQATLLGDLSSQTSILNSELAKLKAKLAGSTGKQRAAIQKEITKVTTQLSNVDQQIVSQLQNVVSTLQSQVGSFLSNVTNELDASFDAATQKLLDDAASTFFQNGAQTPLEKQLADMQAADTVSSLNDALTQAIQQLATDQTGGADTTTLATDNAAVASAQRAITENNLSIDATAERTKADADYAADVKKIQADRAAAEAEMNRQLAALGDALQNGTGSMTDLAGIAAEYGLLIDTATIPDFANLSSTVGELLAAFESLADYIGKLTGTAPDTGAPPGIGGAPPDDRPGSTVTYSFPNIGGAHELPSLDIGGEVLQTGIAKVHRGEIYSGTNGQTFPLSGGDVILMVDGKELGRAAIDGASRDRHTVRIAAKAIAPALGQVVSV